MNQAVKIREIVLELLRDENKEGFSEDLILKKLNINSHEVVAIKYINLKNGLENYRKFTFTEGGIVGALNTLVNKLDNVHKVKTSDGVYFYYLSSFFMEYNKNQKQKISVIESVEYQKIEEQTFDINETVTTILRKSGNGDYLTDVDVDIKHLRKILEYVEKLSAELKTYKQEKEFQRIRKANDIDLPF